MGEGIQTQIDWWREIICRILIYLEKIDLLQVPKQLRVRLAQREGDTGYGICILEGFRSILLKEGVASEVYVQLCSTFTTSLRDSTST